MTELSSAVFSPEERDLLSRYWYPAATSAGLDAGPVAVTVVGEPLVAARLDGTAVAFVDRCTHRGAALSPGLIETRDGHDCLVCPYHGLAFNGGGRAVHLPARPGERLPERLDLAGLACREENGLVWVSLVAEPVGTPPTWQPFESTSTVHFQLEPEVWAAMPSRIIENFNDVAHLGIVHVDTFGVAAEGSLPKEEVRLEADGARLCHDIPMRQLDRQSFDGPLIETVADYRYVHHMPFSTELRIDYDDDRTEWIQISVTPIDPVTALVFQQNVRNFDTDGDLEAWAAFQVAVNTEDRLLLETLMPKRIALDGADAPEVALSVDAFTISYRRQWRELLASAAD